MIVQRGPGWRLPLLVLGMLSLVGGVLAGLARLGITVPEIASSQAGNHAALMVGAFFGTVISLERAVALGRTWAYGAPAAAGLSGILTMAALAPVLSRGLLVAAATVLLAGCLIVIRRQLALYTVILATGAACWLIGSLVWSTGASVQMVVPWWLAFLVLTIAGERLELTRFLPAHRIAPPLFVASVALVLGGALLVPWQEEAGLRIFSAGLLALAAWLLRYDIARHNARQHGLVRFIAICLLSGYFWLALAGAMGIAGAFTPGHDLRDAAVHAVALGFVFAMVFGHAPIIFPAVMRVKIPYHPFFHAPLLALHGSLALRVAGVSPEAFTLRQHGALLNALALVLFIATMLTSVVRGRSPLHARTPPISPKE